MTYTINNLNIPSSTRGTTGLYGVSYMPKFTGSSTPPYVPFASRAEIEKLEPRLSRDMYPYGGEVFNIGGFKSPGEAAYARAYFLANIKSITDWWVKRGGQERKIKTFTSYPWEFPDLSGLDTPERMDGIEAAYNVYKNGGSESEIRQAAEQTRQQNLDRIAASQANNAEEDNTLTVIAKNSALQQTIKMLKSRGANQADILDDIGAYLKQGKSTEEIAKIIQQDYMAEMAIDNETNSLIEDIKRRIKYLLAR